MIELKNGNARLLVEASRGGNIKSWNIENREILFVDEASYKHKTSVKYKGGNPILFPFFSTLKRDGSSEILFDGKLIRLPQHGLARLANSWKALQENERQLTLILHSDEDSLKDFPFEFEFKVHFELHADRLCLRQDVFNPGSSRLAFGAGFHPYFSVSDPKHCELTGIPWGAPLHIQPNHGQHSYDTHFLEPLAFGEEEVNHHFRLLKKSVQLYDRLTGRQVSILRDEHYPCLTAWSEVGENFICIEPNTARRGVFENRQDLIRLAPGQSWTGNIQYVVDCL